MSGENLSYTPLHASHILLGARMVPFAGFSMPVQYTGVLEETKAVRTTAGLFDVSHMGQFSLRGKNALEEVERLVSNDVRKLELGQAQYNMLLNEGGGVIDDLVVYRRSETEIFICVNASNRREDAEWMKSRLGSSVAFEDVSDATALIALQGPQAESILSQAANPAAVKGVKYYRAVETAVLGRPCYVSRTGYTGEDGFELYVAAEHGGEVWDKLLELGKTSGLVPVGLGARDTLRLEMGYPLHGHELSKEISPLEANLGWVVKLKRAVPFVGQAALQKQAESGVKRKLRAFVLEDKRIPRTGYAITLENRKRVGEISSGSFSPHLSAPIALGFISKDALETPRLFIEVREALLPASTRSLPFVPSRTKKEK